MKYFLADLKVWFRDVFIGLSNLWKFKSIVWKHRDWDYSFNLNMEYFQLQLLYNAIEKTQSFEGSEIVLERMKLTLNLLRIIINDKILENKYVNDKNLHRFLPLLSDTSSINYKFLKENLYLEKVWNLYHKARAIYMRKWWE